MRTWKQINFFPRISNFGIRKDLELLITLCGINFKVWSSKEVYGCPKKFGASKQKSRFFTANFLALQESLNLEISNSLFSALNARVQRSLILGRRSYAPNGLSSLNLSHIRSIVGIYTFFHENSDAFCSWWWTAKSRSHGSYSESTAQS